MDDVRLSSTSLVLVLAAVLCGQVFTPPAVAQSRPAESIVAQSIPARTVIAFDKLFGNTDTAIRAVHTKGIVARGLFRPAPGAEALTSAAHLTGGPVPVIVRFSNFAGSLSLPDGAPDASPRGMAIRFFLPDDVDTDIVSHSYNGFPAATPAEFLAVLGAFAGRGPVPEAVATLPAVKAFLAASRPAPVSYATETFYGVNAFRFTNASGASRFGRYRIQPLAGDAHLSQAEARERLPNYLETDITERLAMAPIEFRLIVQLAETGDQTDDGSIPWPLARPTVELGTISLTRLDPDQVAAARALRFTPLNLVGGIAPSKDPMLLDRTQAYQISAERRLAQE